MKFKKGDRLILNRGIPMIRFVEIGIPEELVKEMYDSPIYYYGTTAFDEVLIEYWSDIRKFNLHFILDLDMVLPRTNIMRFLEKFI